MDWTNYPDKIYVINLPDRLDRLLHASAEMNRYNIPVEVYTAVKNDKPTYGIAMTLKNIFDHPARKKMKHILVFEDDVQFLADPNIYMPVIIEQLKNINYDMFYLGVNTTREIKEKTSDNILPLQTAYALHAVLWSRSGMDKFLEMPMELPIDMAISDYIVKNGKAFCSWPMLCTQMPSYSDIERQDVDYSVFLEKRFAEKTKQIR